MAKLYTKKIERCLHCDHHSFQYTGHMENPVCKNGREIRKLPYVECKPPEWCELADFVEEGETEHGATNI